MFHLSVFLRCWLLAACLCLAGANAAAQAKPAAAAAATPAAPAADKAAETPAPPPPVAIPVSDIAAQSETTLLEIRQLENRSKAEDAVESAEGRLPALEREIGFRAREIRQLRYISVTLDAVQGLEETLGDIEQRLAPVRRELTRVALQVDRDLAELDRIDGTWKATIDAASTAAAPAEVIDRARDVARATGQAKKKVMDRRAQVLALQGRASDIGTRISESRQLLTDASERAVTRLLYRDSPPVWSSGYWSGQVDAFSSEAMESLTNQATNLNDYLRTRESSFILHLSFFVLLVLMLVAVRNRMDAANGAEEILPGSRRIFDMPIVSAMLFAMLSSNWFYPRPPRALWLLVAVLVAGPLLVFARRVVGARIWPLLASLVGFYLADRLRALFSPLPGVYRVMLLLEVLALMLFFLTWLRRNRNAPQSAPAEQRFAWRMALAGVRAALLLSLCVLAVTASGYARLGDLLMRSMLASAYTAVVLYVLTREALVRGLLYVPPISFLAGVRRHRALIATRVNAWFKRLAFVLWVVLSLQGAGFLQQAVSWAVGIWNGSWLIGSLNLSIREISMFVLILWTTWMLSRLTRFLLEEEIFSRVRLDRGLPYAVSTTVHYVILLSGLVLALTAAGVDMTRFTIVAGALTVGVGFGLQNIVNNFVSGLIVLFERPVKVGDTIQIGDMIGRVRHIGIRATIVHSTAGSEVIIPNGKLISDPVTNWTLSSQLRQIAVPIITKPDISVAQLKTLLLDIARNNPQVIDTPAPETLFLKRGVDLFEFELRVWTADVDAWMQVRSDLITAINEALSSNALAADAIAPPADPA